MCAHFLYFPGKINRYSENMFPAQDVSTTSGWAQYRCFDSAEAAGSAAVR